VCATKPRNADKIVTTKLEIKTLISNLSIIIKSVRLQNSNIKKALVQNLIYSINILLLDLKTKHLCKQKEIVTLMIVASNICKYNLRLIFKIEIVGKTIIDMNVDIDPTIIYL